MADTAWKKWERKVAVDLGGKRTGPRGYGLADVIGAHVAAECKCFSTMMLRGVDILQAETNAAKWGLPWALFIREKKRGGRKLVVVEYEHYLDLYRAKYINQIATASDRGWVSRGEEIV